MHGDVLFYVSMILSTAQRMALTSFPVQETAGRGDQAGSYLKLSLQGRIFTAWRLNQQLRYTAEDEGANKYLAVGTA